MGGGDGCGSEVGGVREWGSVGRERKTGRGNVEEGEEELKLTVKSNPTNRPSPYLTPSVYLPPCPCRPPPPYFEFLTGDLEVNALSAESNDSSSSCQHTPDALGVA